MDFNALFKKAVEVGASDIHLQAGRRAVFRLHGSLVRVGAEWRGARAIDSPLGAKKQEDAARTG